MDKALKQRLVGATVLIILAIIILPMLLSGRSEILHQESVRIEVPPRPQDLSFETRRFPVGNPEAGSPSVNPPVAQPVESSPAILDPGEADLGRTAPPSGPGTPEAGGTDQPVEAAGASAAPAEPATATAALAPAADRYLVQVASFSSAANANRLAARLRENDMPVLLDNVETDAGILHRVRSGPYAQRSEADAAIAILKRQMGDLSPRVIDLRPDDESTVTDPSDPLVRWVVQAGSFSSADNAAQLVGRLREAGFNAYAAVVTTADATSHKVLIGPEIRRENAVAIVSRLQREMGIDSLVMSTD